MSSGRDDAAVEGQKMRAEFDTVAAWTADAALELGPDFYVAAGCRGSASPAALRWLLDRLAVAPGSVLLDVGAGVGGPVAFAAADRGLRPVLTDPEAGACTAARRLFGLPVVQAANRLPFAASSVDLAWSLGVLCTVDDQPGFLADLRRVLTPRGRLGLLVFCTTDPSRSDPLDGNHFPTAAGLDRLLDDAGWDVLDSTPSSAVGQTPPEWEAEQAAVERVLERDHATAPAWTMAVEQAGVIGDLLASGTLVGRLLVATPTAAEAESATPT
ncbi:MAG: class I SAM-dependent methyltransferase [Propionibacteriaceae bacterium]